MAQAGSGFPWYGATTDANPQPLLEKSTSLEQKVGDTAASTAEAVNKATPTRTLSEKQRVNVKKTKRTSTTTSNKGANKTPMDNASGLGPRHYNVRTIPPWVRDASEDDIDYDPTDTLIDSPHTALVAQHNHAPSNTRRLHGSYPTTSGGRRADPTSRWVSFARTSAYPQENFHNERVTPEWLNEHYTDYHKPWRDGQDENDPEKGSGFYRAIRKKRRAWYTRIQFSIMRNPFVPLAIRLTVLTFAAAAMAIGASIYKDARVVVKCTSQEVDSRTPDCVRLLGTNPVNYYQDPSALMAVIVDAIAIVYTIYITYDEYFSKPLGLRPARAKVRLVLLDLFFIVFQSANLALAFESLTVDEGACAVGADVATSTRFDRICDRAQALSALLTVSLVAWLLTFSVSVLRLVERINAG